MINNVSGVFGVVFGILMIVFLILSLISLQLNKVNFFIHLALCVISGIFASVFLIIAEIDRIEDNSTKYKTAVQSGYSIYIDGVEVNPDIDVNLYSHVSYDDDNHKVFVSK